MSLTSRLGWVHAEHVRFSTGAPSVTERDPGGAGTLTLTPATPHVLCTVPGGRTALHWAKEKKAADAGVIELREDGGARAHLVELKSHLDWDQWISVRRQFAGMLVNLYAVCGVLGLPPPEQVFAYVAFRVAAVDPKKTANPASLKAPLGSGARPAALAEWQDARLSLLDRPSVPLVKVVREASGDATTPLL